MYVPSLLSVRLLRLGPQLKQIERLDHRSLLDPLFEQFERLNQLEAYLKPPLAINSIRSLSSTTDSSTSRSTNSGVPCARNDRKSRLILPRPDLVPLGLFLPPHNTDICSDSRRIIQVDTKYPAALAS